MLAYGLDILCKVGELRKWIYRNKGMKYGSIFGLYVIRLEIGFEISFD